MFKNLFRERRRSSAVRRLTLFKEPADPVLDRLVESAASAFAAPIAALSLIHDEEQVVKTSSGFTLGCLPREDGFCSFTFDLPDVLESCDPCGDERFRALPGVCGEPHVRYYIGAALRLANGMEVGALCVADTVARQPASADQKAYFASLARQASLALEGRPGRWERAA